MNIVIKKSIIWSGLLLVITIAVSAFPQAHKKQFRLAYFEGGTYLMHDALRKEFERQLYLLLPEGYSYVFAPEGYRSADWKRERCRAMARELAHLGTIDMVVAVGPWVVEDLLEAGCTKPILAMHQFDPVAQGLAGDDGRPVAPNLTVHIRPEKIKDDLSTLMKLLNLRKLGVLYFPSGDEAGKVMATIDSLGKVMGFQVITAEGYDNYGTFAFFKAYQQLPKDIDALYLPPLWGMSETKVEQFLAMVARDRIPAYSSEAKEMVEYGAFGSSAAFSTVAEARFNALKAVRIMQGELPADLPVIFRALPSLALNEQTARRCGVTLSNEALNEAYVVAAPPPEEAASYTLTQAMERALAFNPGYLSRYDALEAAAQAAKQAYATYLPQIIAGASAAHLDDNTVANSGGRLEADRYRASLLLHQRVFSLETIRAIQIAAKQKDLERINLWQAKLDLQYAVAAAYLNYLAAREALDRQFWYRTFIDRILQIAGTKAVLEDGSEIDRVRWRDERDKAIARIAQAQNDVRVAAVLLNVLFNLPGTTPFTLDTLAFSKVGFLKDYQELRRLASTPEAQTSLQDFLVSKALAVNPLLRSYEVDLAIRKDLISRNTARFFPSLDLQASLRYANELADVQPSFTEKNPTWRVWGGLTLPLFLGTDRFRERAKLKAQLSQVEFEKDAARLEIMGKVHGEAYDLWTQAGNVPRLIRSASLAKENLRLVAEEYEANKRGLIDLLDAVENGLNAELRAIESRYDFYLSMAKLVHDIGWSVTKGGTFREEFFVRLSELQER
jgi:putative ABC transport system substrate-binding protein